MAMLPGAEAHPLGELHHSTLSKAKLITDWIIQCRLSDSRTMMARLLVVLTLFLGFSWFIWATSNTRTKEHELTAGMCRWTQMSVGYTHTVCRDVLYVTM